MLVMVGVKRGRRGSRRKLGEEEVGGGAGDERGKEGGQGEEGEWDGRGGEGDGRRRGRRAAMAGLPI